MSEKERVSGSFCSEEIAIIDIKKWYVLEQIDIGCNKFLKSFIYMSL
jgi:hypothetical protein